MPGTALFEKLRIKRGAKPIKNNPWSLHSSRAYRTLSHTKGKMYGMVSSNNSSKEKERKIRITEMQF